MRDRHWLLNYLSEPTSFVSVKEMALKSGTASSIWSARIDIRQLKQFSRTKHKRFSSQKLGDASGPEEKIGQNWTRKEFRQLAFVKDQVACDFDTSRIGATQASRRSFVHVISGSY
ncbi:hypothetical protein VTN49DRAFT_1127 [Thermomyces lanuginosus]|uniref:uncharacterized protein n=1 Tax=Thermomyces lanuginosus TaxID=5541 RepID=UPI0037434613